MKEENNRQRKEKVGSVWVLEVDSMRRVSGCGLDGAGAWKMVARFQGRCYSFSFSFST